MSQKIEIRKNPTHGGEVIGEYETLKSALSALLAHVSPKDCECGGCYWVYVDGKPINPLDLIAMVKEAG